MEERTTISLVMALSLVSVPLLAAFAQTNKSNSIAANSSQPTMYNISNGTVEGSEVQSLQLGVECECNW
jgi:hypothetical protein